VTAIVVAALGLVLAQAGSPPPQPADDAWVRLHVALALRTDLDGVARTPRGPDLPLWPDSRYLLEPARHAELLEALAAAVAERPMEDPLRAVCLQQELWATHDWACAARADSPGEAAALEELAAALARTLAELAPAAAQLARLPDLLAAAESAGTLAREADPLSPRQPFLPPGLGRPDGSWVQLAVEDRTAVPFASTHASVFAGRSTFEVHLRLPGGRESTLTWLADLRARDATAACRGTWCADSGAEGLPHEHLARDLPALPAGSAAALVRRALAFDERGELHVTALVQSVQVRAFLAMSEGGACLPDFAEPPASWPWQALCELELELDRSSAPAPARLRPVVAHDPLRFDPLSAHGDPAHAMGGVLRERLDACVACHGNVGLASVVSFTGFSTGPGTQFTLPLRDPPRRLSAADAQASRRAALEFKRARDDWRALRARMGSR
jgi:hypothetical protein